MQQLLRACRWRLIDGLSLRSFFFGEGNKRRRQNFIWGASQENVSNWSSLWHISQPFSALLKKNKLMHIKFTQKLPLKNLLRISEWKNLDKKTGSTIYGSRIKTNFWGGGKKKKINALFSIAIDANTITWHDLNWATVASVVVSQSNYVLAATSLHAAGARPITFVWEMRWAIFSITFGHKGIVNPVPPPFAARSC